MMGWLLIAVMLAVLVPFNIMVMRWTRRLSYRHYYAGRLVSRKPIERLPE